MENFILNFVPTGMIPTRSMTPHVPVEPAQIVDQVLEAVALGVNMVHLHARESGTEHPSAAPELYAQIIEGIRAHCRDLVITVSTSGRCDPSFETRAAVLELDGNLKPDFASLTLSSLNFNHQASINTPETIQALARRMQERGIRPELEAFDLGMINYAKYLATKGLITPPYYFNLILGNIACAQADLLSLGLMIRELPEQSLWSAGGVGNPQLKVNVMALLAGGGVRVGLEDNIWFDEPRTRLATNRELVARVVQIAQSLGLAPYSRQDLRRRLGVAT